MKYCIEDLKDFAESKNGKCLSNKYNNSHTKYKWQCECGHIWESTWSNILHNNSWCSYCAGNLKKTLENCQKLAEKNNGKCLSKEYINNKTKMIWQCDNVHIWNATLNNILNGSWCPYCKGKHIDILDAQKLAEKIKEYVYHKNMLIV